MSRYGWATPRDGLSPFASQTSSQDGPHVTDDDFSYITSEDLIQDSLQAPERGYDSRSRRASRNTRDEEDDLIYIKHKSTSSAERFPAYSISDGKLTVRDVRERVQIMFHLSHRRASRVKMYYKGQSLKEHDFPIRDYGVKDSSEILVVVPEGRLSDDESSTTGEDGIVADPREAAGARTTKKRKNKNGKRKPKNRGPRDATLNLEVPGQVDGNNRGASPDPSQQPPRVPSPAAPQGPLEKLEAIRSHFDTTLLPDCIEFTSHPPKDPKKLEDDYRRISETVMQHVLLKLDEVDTGGDAEIRARRKDLVNYVQGVLSELDEIKSSR